MKTHLIAIFFAFISSVAISQDPFSRTIITQGKSSVKQVPEIISFFIEFEIEDQDYRKCTSRALGKIDTIRFEFEENGIDQDLIKTASYSIKEITERDNRTRRIIHLGYQARIPILIKAKADDPSVSQIFELLQNTFKSEIRISFELSPEQIDKVKETLISLAVSDANSKAGVLAESLNVKLGKVNKVQYGDPEVIRNFTRSYNELRSRAMLTGSSSRTSITTLTPPEMEMATSVVLAWDIDYE